MSTTATHPTPDLFFETLNAYQRTAALRAAIELDIFTAIGDGARTTSAIAKECKAAERGTRMLCDYLTVIGLVSKTGDGYQLPPDSTVFLSKKSPAYLGGLIEFLGSPEIVRNFDSLANTIRNGTITENENNTVADENPVWQKFARAMAPMMMPSAQAMADILGAASAGPIRILDIAAGHGIFGIAMAQCNAQAEVAAVDWASVLKVASENAAKMGVGARHKTLPGDAFKVDFETGYDVALITNFLHHFDTPTCTALLKKVAGSLKAGGRVAVLEFVPNDDRVSPPMAASFVMQMLAGTPRGDAYTFAELRGMLVAAGFTGVAAHPLPGPETLIVGTKP
jgi:2-polyprenyl-3-methyl-5-hydroxy-6-metoxy-1,4-benzoquinol methylase